MRVPGIEANSGSLGMGISKGRGIAWAKRQLGWGGRVVVMVGDGELQEGQNFEALAKVRAHDGLSGLTVVVDRNELQSDKPTEEILALGDLEAKLAAFGWHVASATATTTTSCGARSGSSARSRTARRCSSLARSRAVACRSWSIRPRLRDGGGTYRWHAGAPDDESFERARDELLERIGPVELEPVPPVEDELPAPALEAEPESGAGTRVTVSREYVVEAYGEALVELAARNPRSSCSTPISHPTAACAASRRRTPSASSSAGSPSRTWSRSPAGSRATASYPSSTRSRASSPRARTSRSTTTRARARRSIYALHYAGLIPAGPGMSHQSLRDVSLLAALPNMTIVQPGNAEETRAVLAWAVEEAEGNVAIRLAIGPSPRRIELPRRPRLAPGRGSVLRQGGDVLVFAYGPVMLHEALTAAELLAEHGHDVAVVNMPWLNRFDREWLDELTASSAAIVVVDDHAPIGALGDALRRELPGRTVTVCGVEGWPAFGTPPEALRFHGLDGASLAGRIAEARTLAGA